MTSSPILLQKRFQELSKPLNPVPAGAEPELHKISEIRFLIFDFYGTLFLSGVGDIGVDNTPADKKSFFEALTSCGLHPDNDTTAVEQGYLYYYNVLEEKNADLIRSGFDPPEPAIESVWLEVLQKLSDDSLIIGRISLDVARLFAVEHEARVNPAWPVPGLGELLSKLTATSLEMGIISNSQFYTPILFEALMGKSPDNSGFNKKLLHWSYKEKVKKPAVLLYETFLEKLLESFPDSTPESVLYVGNDMLKDIYPASVSGMKTALFAGDKRSLKWRRDHELCRDLNPDLVITDLRQLTECI